MKQIIKIAHLVIFILLCEVSYAQTKQTQNAVVKTPERRNVNGQITPAKYWDNATVTVMTAGESSKQSYVSGKGGKVGIPAPKPFYVVEASANKGTYTLMDGQFKNKRHSYSATEELDILVDDPYALANAKTEGKQIMKKRLQDSIQAAKNMTEQQYKDGKITEEKYKEQTAQLKNELDSLEKRVENIVIAFLTTDIGKLNGFNKELFIAVEDGDFARVDSLLKTQPSCETIFEEIKEGEATITLAKERTPNRKALLQRLSEKSQEKKEVLFQRLYTEYLNFMQRPLMQDSALHRLKMRADLDTTNVEAVEDYAALCFQQHKLSDCEKYYNICLRAYQQNQDMLNIAAVQNNLGRIYGYLDDHDNSERYYKLALDNVEQLFKADSNAYRAELAAIQNNFGTLYLHLGDSASSKKYFKLALENYEQLYKENPDAYRSNLAASQDNLGKLYKDLHDYANSEKYYKLALENYEQQFKAYPDAYRLNLLTVVLYDLGDLYFELDDYANSVKYYKLASENYEQLSKANPDVYRDNLANTQTNLGTVYYYLLDYANSTKYYELALENYEHLSKDYPDTYQSALIVTQHTLGFVYELEAYYTYAEEQHFKEALESIDKALSLMPTNEEFYDTKGEILLMQGKEKEALAMWKKVLELNPEYLERYPDGTNLSNGLRERGLITK